MCDVAFWKEEVLAEIQRMENECDNVTVRRHLSIILCYSLVTSFLLCVWVIPLAQSSA